MIMTETDVHDAITRYYRAHGALTSQFYRTHGALTSQARVEAVEFSRGQATAYVWGWQDGRPDNRADTHVADAFSWAYGTVAALCEGQTIGMRPSIQDSWRSWLEHGEIRDYGGRALDRIEPRQA